MGSSIVNNPWFELFVLSGIQCTRFSELSNTEPPAAWPVTRKQGMPLTSIRSMRTELVGGQRGQIVNEALALNSVLTESWSRTA